MERIQQTAVNPASHVPVAKRTQNSSAGTSGADEPARAGPQELPDRRQVEEVAVRLQAALDDARPEKWSVAISQDEATGSTIIKIKDAEGEVIKQFPADKILNLRRKLDDLAGVVVDEAT